MTDLGWRAKSATLPQKAEEIEGLRDDFGVRVRSAVQMMRDQESTGHKDTVKESKGRIRLQKNRGVDARAKGDFEMQETDESKERKRLEALERKSRLYEELQKRVDLDDEAANDLHEVDFIGKALKGDAAFLVEEDREDTPANPLHPEEILRRQQEIRSQMQGGESRREEYSTYQQDEAELAARHRVVDERDVMNAERQSEFDHHKRKREAQANQRNQEAAKQKQDILKRLLAKKQRQK